MTDRPLAVGDRLHGACGGLLGRESFGCRTVEARGVDWVIVREDDGTPDVAFSTQTLEDLERYREPIQESRYTVACECVRGQADWPEGDELVAEGPWPPHPQHGQPGGRS